MSLDEHGQPLNTSFNFSRNKDKAVYGLKGVLEGITADEKLNELELSFLDMWLKEQSVLDEDGDVIDLLDLIGDILSDGIITEDELSDLYTLSKDIICYRETEPAENESKINELVGLLSGIVSDNNLNDHEITKLINWVKNNPDIANEWPIDVVVTQLGTVLSDGVATEEERTHLLEVIKKITGVRFEETGVAYGMAAEFFEDEINSISHDGSVFCFTGAFVTGKRNMIQNKAKQKGAIIKNKVTQDIDYLVVGTLASRDWRFTSHGRKIEEALKLKKLGKKITIVTERTWLNYI